MYSIYNYNNGFIKRIIEYYRTNTDNGVREVIFGQPVPSFIELTPSFPYYEDGIRGVEFDGNYLKTIYVSMNFLKDDRFLRFFKNIPVVLVDTSDFDNKFIHYYYSNMKFLNVNNNINLYLMKGYLDIEEIEELKKYPMINLIGIDNPKPLHYSKVISDFDYYFIANMDLDIDSYVNLLFDDINYIFNQFSILDNLKIHLRVDNDILKENFAEFIDKCLLKYYSLDIELKKKLENQLNQYKNKLIFVVNDRELVRCFRYMSEKLEPYKTFMQVFKVYLY